MASFLDRLNEKLNTDPSAPQALGQPKKAGANGASSEGTESTPAAVGPELLSRQLDVDVLSTSEEVVIFAQVSGVDSKNLQVKLDPDGDAVIIEGERKRPTVWGGQDRAALLDAGKFVQQECKWEKFYRKVILPAEVDVTRLNAHLQLGTLILHLPILKLKEGRPIPIQEQ
jgi:HSP20 family molecular chaperone IbpA